MRTARLSIWLYVLAVSAPIAAAGPPSDSSQQAQPAQATPPSETTAAQSTATDSSTAAPPKSAAAPEVKLKPTDAEAEAEVKRLKAAGYRPELFKGQLMFCRKEPELGSRFEKKHCGSLEQLTAAADQGREATEHAQRVAPQLPRGN